MLCGADKKHGLMLRVGPEQYQKTLKLKHTSKMDMTGVPLKGFIFVDPSGYKTKTSLKKWIERAMDFTKTLPKKTK